MLYPHGGKGTLRYSGLSKTEHGVYNWIIRQREFGITLDITIYSAKDDNLVRYIDEIL